MKERLMEFIQHKEISNRKFLLKCGLSGTYISTLTGNPSGDTIKKIEEAYPELNTDWLLTGAGEMLKVPATMTIYNPSQEEHSEAGDGVDISVYPAEIIEEVEEEIKKKESVIVISPEIANAPNTNIRKHIKEKGDELERIYLGDLLPAGAKVAERVRKTSMLPDFQPGDWVFVKFINKDNITDGETYYFDFNTRPTMIRKVKIEGDNLRLIAKNPRFGDIIVKCEEINNIGDVVGLFRSYFGGQYDDIEAVRRKKEEQIDSLLKQSTDLIEQNGKALKIIENLINK